MGDRVVEIRKVKHRLHDVNITGLRLDKANMAGARVREGNLGGASIADCRLDGMTIDGVLVSDLFAAYKASRAIDPQQPA
jgi:uncharacterized protein YjbI with pentapeptide repeats